MRVSVIGASGMAGHIIASHFKMRGAEVLTFGRQGASNYFDILDPATHNILNLCYSCDYVINCAGLLIADCDSDPVRAYLVNSWFPHRLCTMLETTGVRLIHLSTDCVFDGTSGPYDETCVPTETSTYGRSKTFGEIHSMAHVTFRTSIIGPEVRQHTTGLFEWFINKSTESVTGYTDAYWNGITTLELAKCCWDHCNSPGVSGIYHLTRNESFSKFDVLTMINNEWELGKTVVPGLAPKPVNKCLLNSNPGAFEISPFPVQLRDLKLWMQDNLK